MSKQKQNGPLKIKWQYAVEASRIGVWDWNITDSTAFFSSSWKRMLGYKEDEIGNALSEWEERVHPDDLNKTLEKVQRHLDGETNHYESVHRMRCKDGSYKWILDRGKVLERDESGQPLRVIGTHSDLSEYKQMETQLREEQQRLHAILQTTMDGFFIVDTHGRFKETNDSYSKQIGYSKGELRTMGLGDVEAIETQNDTATHIKNILKKGADRFQTKHRKKNGDFIDFEVSVNYLPLDGGIFVVFTRDVTRQKKDEQALRESESKFRELAENIDEVFWLRTDDRIMYISPAYERIWGRSCQSLYDNPNSFIESIHKVDKDRVIKAFNSDNYRLYGKFDEEYRIERPDGQLRWVWARSFPISYEGNKSIRRTSIAQDITSRKEAEFKIRREEKLLTGIASATNELLINQDFEVAMRRSLTILGKFIQVDRVYYFENHYDDKGVGYTSQRFEWNSGNHKPHFDSHAQPRISAISCLRRATGQDSGWMAMVSLGRLCYKRRTWEYHGNPRHGSGHNSPKRSGKKPYRSQRKS